MAKKSGLGKGLDALFLDNDTDDREDVRTLRLSEIEPNKNQPRKAFDDGSLSELADSIREHGILQPLLVVPDQTGRYRLVAGERRWRAARMIGLDTVPVLVRELSETQIMEIALVENLQRENLNPLEEAAGYRELMDTCGLTQEQAAKRVGKSRSAVANALRLLNFPDSLKPLLLEGKLTAGHAKALMGLSDREAMEKLARTAAEKGLSVREVEREVARLQKPAEKPEKAGKKDPYFQELELSIKEELGRKVKIRPAAFGGGVIELPFYDKEDLVSIAYRLAGEDKNNY